MKLSSEAAEPVQRDRFGVIPQMMAVLLAQVLFFLKSIMRSATIIGAINGGSIGLKLTQAVQRQKDCQGVAY